MSTIDISKHDKAAVLAALYNNSHPQGMGFMQASEGDIAIEDAQVILDKGQTYFDYLRGRVMKVDLAEASFDPSLYDRDLGDGAAQRAIDSIS